MRIVLPWIEESVISLQTIEITMILINNIYMIINKDGCLPALLMFAYILQAKA
jgi:hypothetical protein